MNATTKPKPDKPEIAMVKLDELFVDEDYQRTTRMDLIQEIANDWRDEACGLILVNVRKSGKRYIVDGQHRHSAAKWLEKTELPARMTYGLTAKQEAHLRLQTNRKRNETAAERFRAELVSENPVALGVMRVLMPFKAKLLLDPHTARADSIMAISSIERLYRMDKGDTLANVLRLIHDADGELNAGNTPTRILWAVEWWMRMHAGQYDRKRLVNILRQQKAAIKARGAMLAVQLAGSTWLSNYRAMIEFYNDGLPKAEQLEAITRGYKASDTDRGISV